MLLREISSKDPVTSIVVNALEKTAPILKDVSFYAKAGSADAVKKAREGNLTSVFRTLNNPNIAVPPIPEYIPAAKKIISFDVQVDVLLEDRNEDPEAELIYQTRIEAESAGYLLQAKIFNGDSAEEPVVFDGLKNLTPEDNILVPAANGLVIPLGNTDAKVTSQQQALEELLKLFATIPGGATHAYMNEYLKIRWLTVAKALGYYRTGKDELGDEIEKIGNVIIRGAGYAADGTPLLPFTDTVGTSVERCSDIFAVRWGERTDLTALTSVGVKVRYAGQSGNFLTNNVNMDMALVLQNPSALYRSRGWRID